MGIHLKNYVFLWLLFSSISLCSQIDSLSQKNDSINIIALEEYNAKLAKV